MKRRLLGRPRVLYEAQCAELSKVLFDGALTQGFATGLWTLPRVTRPIRERFASDTLPATFNLGAELP